jgi:O-succinylbenzoate synthase
MLAEPPPGASQFPPLSAPAFRSLGDMPPVEELIGAAHVVVLPMRVKFRGILERETLLLRGPVGWGEFGAFPEYGDAEAARWLAAAIEAGWHGFPEPLRTSIPVNATVPAVPAARVPEILARFGRVDAVKIKVAERGQTLDDDAARVDAVRAALPDAAIRVDANGGWDVPEAVEALTRLAGVGLEYAEQPVPDIEGLAEVRRRLRSAGIPVPIAADESVRKEDDPLKVARAGAADLIVVKVAPLGGVRRALSIVAQAGLPAVVSSALDTSVGIRAGLALAAALPELPYACGLGTVSLLAGDVTVDPLVADDGAIRLRDAVADEGLLELYAASAERREWWLARLRRAYAEIA